MAQRGCHLPTVRAGLHDLARRYERHLGLSSQIITYNTSDPAVPGQWQATVNAGNYAGSAEIRAIYTRPSDGGQVVLTSVPVNFQ
ncbi:MAG: hypothetical protein HZC41_03630 [Chloroflexi bacterium]|nr:hypothetical protein [Chloroflexota bacterium]